MSGTSDDTTSPELAQSAEGSPVRTSAPPVSAKASRANARASGGSTRASSKKSLRSTRSSRTSPPVHGIGCPTCGETCTCWGTEPVPSRFLPSTSERPTSARECSFLLPTPSASSYGTNIGGAAGRVGKVRASLQTMARKGLLPTPTIKGNYNRAGASARSGDGVATVIGGPLNPRFLEWLMGFPDGWTEIDSAETLAPPSKPKRSAA